MTEIQRLTEQVNALRNEVVPALRRIEAFIAEITVKRPTKKELAKRAGVHPRTISRRLRRAEMQWKIAQTL